MPQLIDHKSWVVKVNVAMKTTGSKYILWWYELSGIIALNQTMLSLHRKLNNGILGFMGSTFANPS